MNKWINNNNIAKVLALAVSILLWGMVHMDDVTTIPTTKIDTRIIENLKVQPFGLDEKGYILSAMDNDRVRIEVKGKKTELMSVLSEDYRVRLDLSHAKVGTSTLPLTADLPSGVELVSMQPSTVTVNIEKRDTSEFPVTITTKGTPAAGYQAGKVAMDPATVRVTLPESELKNVAKVQGTVSIDGEDATIKEKRVKLSAYDKDGQEIKGAVIEPSTISVLVPITPPYKEMPIDLQYTGKLPEGLVISKAQTNVAKVKLYGSQEALAGIKSYGGVQVDLSQIQEAGTMVFDVDLTPPSGFEKIEPSSLQVEITTVTNSQRVIDDIPITVKGAGEDVAAAVTDPPSGTMSLTLNGAPGLLNNLTKNDIELIANVSNLDPGTHQVTLQVVLPRYISRVDQGKPLTATVEIKDMAPPVTTKPDTGSGNKHNDGTGAGDKNSENGSGSQDKTSESGNTGNHSDPSLSDGEEEKVPDHSSP